MIIIASNQSPSHLALRDCAASANLEPALRRFLWEINAHWNLVALPLICENLREMLNLSKDIWNLDLDEWKLESWFEVIDWIFNEQAALAGKVGKRFFQGFGAKGEHPLMGAGVLRHSVYATLCNSHNNPRWRETYRLLQAHLLFAKISVTRKYTTLAEYESYNGERALLEKRANPYHAALAVRRISERLSGTFLSEIEDSVRFPPLDFLSQLVEIVPSTTEDIARCRDLAVFFGKAFQGAGQRKRNPQAGGGSDSGRSRLHGGKTDFLLAAQSTDNSFEDEEDKKSTRRGRHSTTVRLRHKREQAEERIDVDDCPGEDEEDEEIDGTDIQDEHFQRSPGSFHEVSAAQAMQVQMANQLFPWSYGTLTIAEIAPVIIQRRQQMADTIAAGPLTNAQFQKLEVLALAEVMFWTSSSIEQAVGLRMLHQTTSGMDAVLSLLPKTSTTIAQWRIRSPLPSYCRPQEPAPPGMDRERIDYLRLPDVADGSFLVHAFLEQKARMRASDELHHGKTNAVSNPSSRVFRHPLAWYRKQLRLLFESVDPDTRMTEGRLSRFLFSRVLEASGGDLSAAAIITGNDIPLSRVKLFYACPSVSRLQTLYTDVAIGVQEACLRALEKEPPPREKVIVETGDTYIGNRLCPARSAVRQAIRKLQEEIQCTWQMANYDEHRRHHNLLTLYTLLMFSYTTGVRGISTPYLNLSEIDPELRLGTLTDKDSGVGYKTRLIRVTPMLLKQMEFYKDFIACAPHLPQDRKLPCFFLDEELKPVEVRPKTLVPIMQDFLPFPVNIHRRFVSSELLDAGCPPEIVSAWMGHWHRGEEPWGKFSSFSFHDYVSVLESFLDPLIEYLGFRALPGNSHFKLKELK